MLFAGKTKSGSTHLWPRWWCFFFGGTFRQKGGGYGTVYSIPRRIRRYYREDWRRNGSLLWFIWDQGPYAHTGAPADRRPLLARLRYLWRFASCTHRNATKCLAFPDSTELVFCTACGRVLWCMDDGDRTHNMHLRRDRIACDQQE